MNVAVIGAGVMGTGVAHNMAQYGISTKEGANKFLI